MKKHVMIGIAMMVILGLVGSAGVSPALAKASTTTTSYKVPVHIPSFLVPCANGGSGEEVDLEGYFHILIHTTDDGNGGFHLKGLGHPQMVKGIGRTTGDKYQGAGVDNYSLNLKVGETETEVSIFRIVGQGPGNNFTLEIKNHLTVNANGEVTAQFDDVTAVCK